MIDLARLLPPSTLLGRTLRWPFKLLRRGTVVPVILGPLRGSRWVLGSGLHGCWLGTYEWPKQRLFASLVSPGMVVYDIGANVGFYTLLAARRVGPTGAVFAFEPGLGNLADLRRHIELNRCDNTKVLDVAVADRCKEARFLDAGSYTGRLDERGGREVRMVSLDWLLDEGTVKAPDLVKIDVEGAEEAVLLGATRLLERYHPVLLLATHGQQVHQACTDLLSTLGYSLRSLEPGRSVAQTSELLAWHSAERPSS